MKMSDHKRRRKLLLQCEELLVEHMEVLVKAGGALRKIHNEELFKAAGYKTMQKFCTERHGMTRKVWAGLIEITELRDAIGDAARLREATKGP